MKLQFKITFAFLSIIIILSLVNLLTTSTFLVNLQEERLSSAEVVFAKSLSKRIYRDVVELKTEKITSVLFEEQSFRKDKIQYILVEDSGGFLLAHTFINEFPKELLNLNNDNEMIEGYQIKNFVYGDVEVYDLSVPIMEGIKQIGTMHIGIKANYVENIITPKKKPHGIY